MKKIISLCLFIIAMLYGNPSVEAQNTTLKNKMEINAKAMEKTEALRKFIDFSDEQSDRIYQTYREHTIARLNVDKSNVADKAEVKKIEERLETKMKHILTDSQFKRFKEFKQE